MADWAHALSQGLGAAALTGAGMIDDQMKVDRQIAAEQRAADLQMDIKQRLMAAEEMMKNRAAESFSGYVNKFAGEEVPVAAKSVLETGVTADSGKALGKFDFGNGPQDVAGITGSADKIKTLIQDAQAKLQDPNLTDEQRQDYEGLIAQLSQQVMAQDELNQGEAKGKTRARTTAEAIEAAREYSLRNDPAAFMAGNAMLAPGEKAGAAATALEQKERLATTEAERKERQAAADRESREAIADRRAGQSEKAADQRFAAMMARLDANKEGKGGSKSGTVQTLEFLRDELGWNKAEIGAYLTQSKHASVEDIYLKLKASNDKSFGEATDDELMEQARNIANMSRDGGKQSGGKTTKALPAGAKQVGTSGGKPVYETPDGKRFIQD